MDIHKLNPDTFIGPRAYFTAFDYRIISRKRNLDSLRRNVERRLKLLLLIKSRIVCAASHLASKFAYDFFKDNPILLTENLIVPALRLDKTDISELFEKKRFANKEEAIHFYKDNLNYVVSWDLEDNSAWFKKCFVKELKDNRSLIRTHLNDLSETSISSIVERIDEDELLSRHQVDLATKQIPRKARKIILDYRELIYHMSGARVVNCESSLPQENYIDYDLADLSQRRSKLSEEQIFWKLLIELIIESFQMQMLPIELLDRLSFEDILLIRKPILRSNFQEKYDLLINNVVLPIRKGDTNIVLNLNQLEDIRKDLEKTFQEIFESELPVFMKKKLKENTKELSNSTSSMALGVAGLFLPVAGMISIAKDSPNFLFNVRQTYKSIKDVSNYEQYMKHKEQALRHYIEKKEISDKSTMIELVDYLTDVISKKLHL